MSPLRHKYSYIYVFTPALHHLNLCEISGVLVVIGGVRWDDKKPSMSPVKELNDTSRYVKMRWTSSNKSVTILLL